ncbi:hypothetical protein BC828DRAFT_99735 [Blastocladiella britannica]|nr:hypothetical protein BC828DRAFT_99735 [Blastocladiella britannica]
MAIMPLRATSTRPNGCMSFCCHISKIWVSTCWHCYRSSFAESRNKMQCIPWLRLDAGVDYDRLTRHDRNLGAKKGTEMCRQADFIFAMPTVKAIFMVEERGRHQADQGKHQARSGACEWSPPISISRAIPYFFGDGPSCPLGQFKDPPQSSSSCTTQKPLKNIISMKKLWTQECSFRDKRRRGLSPFFGDLPSL